MNHNISVVSGHLPQEHVGEPAGRANGSAAPEQEQNLIVFSNKTSYTLFFPTGSVGIF